MNEEPLYTSLLAIPRLLPENHYFIYGSMGLDIRFGRIGQFSREKSRVVGLPPNRVIDIAIHPEVTIDQILMLQREIFDQTNGHIMVDAHYMQLQDPDALVIGQCLMPQKWFVPDPIQFLDTEFQVLNPFACLLVRELKFARSGGFRPKDTHRIREEIKLTNLSITELVREERIQFGLEQISENRSNAVLAKSLMKLLIGLLPERAYDTVLKTYRQIIPDRLLGEKVIRETLDFL